MFVRNVLVHNGPALDAILEHARGLLGPRATCSVSSPTSPDCAFPSGPRPSKNWSSAPTQAPLGFHRTTRAYTDAGYFARNVRTIEVLLDRDAVTSGAAAAAGEPWQHYDVGRGWCTYSFFEQCPHRMACARCDFYTCGCRERCHSL